MEFKIYIQDIEIDFPLYTPENDLDIMLDLLKNDFKTLVDNGPVLKYFGIDLNYGK
jgi:hypothetical protein